MGRDEARFLMNNTHSNEDVSVLYRPLHLLSLALASFQPILLVKSQISNLFPTKSLIALRMVAYTGCTQFEQDVFVKISLMAPDGRVVNLPDLGITRIDDPVVRDHDLYPSIEPEHPDMVYVLPEFVCLFVCFSGRQGEAD